MSVLVARSLQYCSTSVRIPCTRLKSTANCQRAHLQSSIVADEVTPRALKGITFDDYKECFGYKSTWELLRAISVLQLCSVEKIADNSLELMKAAEKLVGVRGLRLLFKPTVYNQFVGGETTEELRACTRSLARTGMRAMLAATLEEDVGEGKDEIVYNNNCQRILNAIGIVTTEDIKSPMIQLKLSGLLSADMLLTVGNIYAGHNNKLSLIKALAEGMSEGKLQDSLLDEALDEAQKRCLERALERFKKIGTEAKRKGVKVLVDAEITYLNPGLSCLALAAVAVFNLDASVIWNTYQCYLRDAEILLKEELSLVTELGCHFGAKLVRGAYMSQERSRAQKLKISDPVCENYTATCNNYNKILSFLLDKHYTMGPQCQFIIASHNVESIKFAVKKIEDMNMDKDLQSVCFGQLYGMCDQVSNPLMRVGLPVYKSIPYGKIDEVLPYLARRAVENKSVLEGARNELILLKKELRRRVQSTLHM
ncbi:hydroxyproline dehydrogenase-like [Parasteatoda tepidariorum]|uniref:hydroxyproline dehydrogenase-like n=1 Tax=Parasteatoda tepidariorum TaxID=114398 RepID=UPI001C71FE71|nr:hydroxyproline dehydrogenase-like [Parasteatoda tepidariorum]